MTTASMHVRAWHLTACVWLGWTMALHDVSVGMVSSYSGWLNWYATAAAAVCVVLPPTTHTPTPTRRPSDLQMVHAMLTLAVKVWLCGMWPAHKPTLKPSSLIKISKIFQGWNQRTLVVGGGDPLLYLPLNTAFVFTPVWPPLLNTFCSLCMYLHHAVHYTNPLFMKFFRTGSTDAVAILKLNCLAA